LKRRACDVLSSYRFFRKHGHHAAQKASTEYTVHFVLAIGLARFTVVPREIRTADAAALTLADNPMHIRFQIIG
jgi:hypothetical protein